MTEEQPFYRCQPPTLTPSLVWDTKSNTVARQQSSVARRCWWQRGWRSKTDDKQNMTGRKECRLSLWGLESSAAGDVKFDKVVIPEESSVSTSPQSLGFTLRKHSRTQAKLHKPAKFEWEILHVSLTTGLKLFCTYFRLWFAILPQLKHCCLCLYFSSFLSHFLCSFSVFRQLPPHSSKMWNTHPKKSISSCLWILIVSFFCNIMTLKLMYFTCPDFSTLWRPRNKL